MNAGKRPIIIQTWLDLLWIYSSMFDISDIYFVPTSFLKLIQVAYLFLNIVAIGLYMCFYLISHAHIHEVRFLEKR